MKKRDIAFLVFAVILVSGLLYVWFTPSGVKPAPQITVAGINGNTISIKQYRGHPLLVTFWATSCPGCVAEMPHLVKLYHDLNPKGLQILAIAMSYDHLKEVKAMVAQKQLPYTVALDHDAKAAKAFGNVNLTPTSFLISPNGRIVEQKIGNLDMARVRRRIDTLLKAS